MKPIYVLVGTKNPNKIEAVKLAFEKFFNKNVDVKGISVDSGVPEQPINEETFLGAKNRVINLLKYKGDFYVGLESGLINICGTYFVITVCCISDGNKYYFGVSPGFKLKDSMIKEMLNGVPLSKIAEKVEQEKDTNKKKGFINVISNKTVERKDLNYFAVLMALSNYNIENNF